MVNLPENEKLAHPAPRAPFFLPCALVVLSSAVSVVQDPEDRAAEMPQNSPYFKVPQRNGGSA